MMIVDQNGSNPNLINTLDLIPTNSTSILKFANPPLTVTTTSTSTTSDNIAPISSGSSATLKRLSLQRHQKEELFLC